ncbi:MAG TPA: hypothetical protein VIE65_00520 [Methylobacter sp.]|jgi:hypothetical protein
MPKRWVGIVVSSDKIIMVDAEIPKSGPLILQSDIGFRLQKGARPAAYAVMHQNVSDYVRENKIAQVIIKASAVSLGGTKKAHLEAAELRGVVMAASASITDTICLAKGNISKTFGARKVDEYLSDDAFWEAEISGSIRSLGREAAMLLLAARKNDA